MAGKKLGKKSMLYGALAQSIPDIDFVAAFWTDNVSNLLAHRGFTHSILFVVLVTIFCALLLEHFEKKHLLGYKQWLYFIGFEMFIHLLLDICNGYGMGLFEPFSHYRYAFNIIFVADPFFSIWPGLAFLVLLLLKARINKRRFWYQFAIAGSSIYFFYCIINKIIIDKNVRNSMSEMHSEVLDYFTTPTPLNNWLWYVVIKQPTGYLIAFKSVFDSRTETNYHYFPRQDSLIAPLKDHEEIQKLIRFSKGFYTVERWKDTLVFNDLRFGQVVGWHNPKERFVFHYFLQHPQEDNLLLVQRGRFMNWNKETVFSLLNRIKGN